MVATVRCEEIAYEKLRLLSTDKVLFTYISLAGITGLIEIFSGSQYLVNLLQVWLALEEAIQVGPVPGFGKKLSSILDTYLSE